MYNIYNAGFGCSPIEPLLLPLLLPHRLLEVRFSLQVVFQKGLHLFNTKQSHIRTTRFTNSQGLSWLLPKGTDASNALDTNTGLLFSSRLYFIFNSFRVRVGKKFCIAEKSVPHCLNAY